MVAIMKDNGVKIKSMVLVLFTLKMVVLNIKVNGETIYTMVGVLYMLRLETGVNMKVNSKMALNKVEVESTSVMALFMMVNSEAIKFLEGDERLVKMEKSSKNTGMLLILRDLVEAKYFYYFH